MRKRASGTRQQINNTVSSTEKPGFGFDSLIDQDRPVRVLTAVLSSGNLPHAFLFTGLEGVGKKTAAMTVAMACNCLTLGLFPEKAAAGGSSAGAMEPCGNCRSCRKILSGHHPDVILVAPQGDLIKVDQIRGLIEKLTLKPYEAAKRVIIIAGAHQFNTEAGNTLLKTLEEPPEHTLFILTAPQAADMLPTIVSRCQQVRFNPIDRHSLAAYVASRYAVTEAEGAAIAAMSGGSLSQADRMAQDGWTRTREWVLREMETLPSQPVNASLAFAEALAKNKDLVFTAFEIMKNWLRDIALCQHQPKQRDKFINEDLFDRIQNAASRATPGTVTRRFKAIEQAERAIRSNANVRLTLDALMLSLCKGS